MVWPPGVRGTLHDDVEDLLLLEHAADLDALQQRRAGAANETGRDAEALRLVQVHLDLDRGLPHGQVDPRVGYAGNVGDHVPDPRRFTSERSWRSSERITGASCDARSSAPRTVSTPTRPHIAKDIETIAGLGRPKAQLGVELHASGSNE